MKELVRKKKIGYSFVFMLINITSITVITSLTGLNLRMAFIASGIATLLFHKLTKNKIPSFIGMSGSFVGGMIAVSQSQGVEYALGGVIGGGITYASFKPCCERLKNTLKDTRLSNPNIDDSDVEEITEVEIK